MKIGSVIVTYNPRLELLESSMKSLEIQVDKIIIVDNNSKNFDLIMVTAQKKNTFVIKLEDNFGIAKAANIGINYLLNSFYDFVLLSDQDTLFPSNYISNFIFALSKLNNNNIAAFVPCIYDNVSNIYKHCYIKGKFFIKKIIPNYEYTNVFQAIASGMLINLKIFSSIGGMMDELFIDMVDFEWCWRANYYDYKIICCKQLVINHHLGDSSQHIFKKAVNTRSDIRYYYLIRNSFFLSIYNQILPLHYKVISFFLSFKYIIGYPLVSKKPVTTLKYCLHGMFDGIIKNMGKYNK